MFVDQSYGLVDINKVGYMEVCWWHTLLTSALRVCDTEHHMLDVLYLSLLQQCIQEHVRMV